MGVMVMTTMATAYALSFLEVEGEVAVAVVVEEWDPQGQDMVPPLGALKTELLCQVGGVFLLLHLMFFSLPKCVGAFSESYTFSPRSSSQWKLAGPEGSHARGR